MEKRSQKLYTYLQEFFKNDHNFKLLLQSINGHNGFSLRLIDWLVTNFSKENNVIYKVNNKNFVMHQSYKDMLKAYSKKLFDPFRRQDRITITNKNQQVYTTVAQMTFFKWAIDNKVLDYAKKHKSSIKEHMDKHTSHRKLILKNTEIKTKRKELSKRIKLHKINNIDIKISFN